MEREKEAEGPAHVWINESERIISFRQDDGFEPVVFPSRDEMMAFVVKMGSSGYRIQ